MKKEDIKIEIYQQDWMEGFAAFLDDGSMEKGANPKVLLNLGAFLATVKSGDIEQKDLPYFIAECIMHEVIHVLENWANVEFNEEKVHALIEKYQKKYHP